MSKTAFTSSYAFDPYVGAACHFIDVSRHEVDGKLAERESVYIVEAVDTSECRSIRYFADGLSDALALAARLEIGPQDAEKYVVRIYPAPYEEAKEAMTARAYFSKRMPKAVHRIPDGKK